MKKLFLTVFASIGALVMCSCSTVNSTLYTKGAVQAARTARTGRPCRPNDNRDVPPQLFIKPFADDRFRQEEISRLWLCAVPGLSVFSRWEKPDWLNWDRSYAGYKPFNVDLTEVVQDELRLAGISTALDGDRVAGAEGVVLEGTVEELTLTLNPHFLGLSYLIGEPLGLVGVPLGNWSVIQQLSFRLRDRNSGRVIWQKSYATQTDGWMGMYYGRNPLSHGYPYRDLLAPVLADLTVCLKEHVGNQDGNLR